MNKIDKDRPISKIFREYDYEAAKNEELEVNIFKQNFVKNKEDVAAATALQGVDDDEPEVEDNSEVDERPRKKKKNCNEIVIFKSNKFI